MKTPIIVIILCVLCSCGNKKSIEKAQLLYETGKIYEEAEHPDSALISYFQAADLLEGTNEYELRGDIYNRIGEIALVHQYYDYSLESFEESYRLALKLEDSKLASRSLRSLGKIYILKESLPKALKLKRFKSTDLYIKIKSLSKIKDPFTLEERKELQAAMETICADLIYSIMEVHPAMLEQDILYCCLVKELKLNNTCCAICLHVAPSTPRKFKERIKDGLTQTIKGKALFNEIFNENVQ